MPVALRKGTKYTYHDYLTWPDEKRWEVIEGVAYDMSPAPSVKHQDIVGNFYIRLKSESSSPCYTGISPTDVVLDEHNVVQPDVFVVCDRSKIGERAITGAPDLVIEVVSPATYEQRSRTEERKRQFTRSSGWPNTSWCSLRGSTWNATSWKGASTVPLR